MSGLCKKCGWCCRVLVINVAPDIVAGLDTPDARFVRANWVRITEDEAFARDPVTFPVVKDKYNASGSPVVPYRCLKFDDATGLCGANGQKPKICREYPCYSGVDGVPFLQPDCGFISLLG